MSENLSFLNIETISQSEAASHPYLERISRGGLNAEQMRKELLERYRIAQQFVPFMEEIRERIGGLGQNVKKQAEQMLTANLNEETGFGNPEKAHKALWHKLLRAIGLSDEAIQSDGRSAEALIYQRDLMHLSQAPTPVALGALAFGEGFVGIEYAQWLEGCRKIFPHLLNPDLTQLISHVSHDPKHLQEVVKVLEAMVIESRDRLSLIHEGAERANALRMNYFDERFKLL